MIRSTNGEPITDNWLLNGYPGAEFKDGRGNSLSVTVDMPGTEVPSDAFWRLAPDASGHGLAMRTEGKACTVEDRETGCGEGEGTCETCTAGDGRFSVVAVADVLGHNFVFFFEMNGKETGVDLTDFRNMLASFRALGPAMVR